MALWTALPRFRGESSERTWVYRVAHNTALTFAASRRRRDSREQPGEPPQEPALPASQERQAIEQQRRNLLWAAVQALPVDERQIVVLHLEGLSATEIEAITGVAAGAVATRLTRFRQKLATQIRGIRRWTRSDGHERQPGSPDRGSLLSDDDWMQPVADAHGRLARP